MRIIAGLHKGRRLKPIKGNSIRPTTDRVREAVFNVLGERPRGAEVLDLFAGSGALGMEALSRGALHAVFVDKDFYAVKLIKSNLELIHEISRGTVIKGDVFRVFAKLALYGPYDIIFADPPYRTAFQEELVGLIIQDKLLSADGVLVFETSPDFTFKKTLGFFREVKTKQYGDTKVCFMFQ